MPELYKNKYRIKSTRLQEYNYGQDGLYFVTICTKECQCFFGKIVNEKMILNQLGEMADKYWKEIVEHFKFVKLDEYIITPNHIHGIIVIDNDGNGGGGVGGVGGYDHGRDVAMQRLYEQHPHHQHKKTKYTGNNPQMSKISPKPGSLSAIIRSYKSIVTRESKPITPNFAWQARFYDHIICNGKSLDRIRQYIINNPMNWNLDRNNLEI